MGKLSIAEAHEYVERLANQYRPMVYKYVQHLMEHRDTDEAEDITQEAFLRAYEHVISKCDEISHPQAWLKTIAKHCYLRSLRDKGLFFAESIERPSMFSSSGRDTSPLDIADNQPGPDMLFVAREQKERITDEMIALLPESLKQVFQLSTREYTPTEIAQILQQRPGTTRTYLSRARKVVQRMIVPDD